MSKSERQFFVGAFAALFVASIVCILIEISRGHTELTIAFTFTSIIALGLCFQAIANRRK